MRLSRRQLRLLPAGLVAGFLLVIIFRGSWWLPSPESPTGRGSPFPTRPNLILFSIDTLRADHLGSYGYPRPTSPHFDALARDSVLFTGALSQAPWTAPSHMTMLTGLMPPVHEIYNFCPFPDPANPLKPGVMTLAQVLQHHGYRTGAYTADIHLGKPYGFAAGFEFYREDFFTVGEMVRDAAGTSARCRAELRAQLHAYRNQPAPFFLFLHHYLCHEIYLAPPAEYRQRFAAPVPPGLPAGPEDINWNDSYHDFWRRFRLSDPDHRRYAVGLYDSCISCSDLILGQMVAMLKEEGLYENTMLIVTSDHGEELMEHGGTGHGRLYREHLRVPLLIKFPGSAGGGRRIDAPVRTVDLMPTILDLFHLPRLRIQGISFTPLLTGSGTYAPVLVSYQPQTAGRGSFITGIRLTRDGYTYLRQAPAEERLFQTERDPLEQKNLAAQIPELVRQFRQETDGILAADGEWRAAVSRFGPGDTAPRRALP